MPPESRLIELVERHCAEAYAAEAGVACAEVHIDADVAWVVHSGSTWRNSAIAVRFREREASARLAAMIRRYQQHGLGRRLFPARPSSCAVAG